MVAIQPAPHKNIVDLRLLLIYTILSGDYENEKGMPNFLNYFFKPLVSITKREKNFRDYLLITYMHPIH